MKEEETDTIRLKVSFYYNGFREGIIEVPCFFDLLGEGDRRGYVVKYIMGALGMKAPKYDVNTISHCGFSGSIEEMATGIKIITCKKLKQ